MNLIGESGERGRERAREGEGKGRGREAERERLSSPLFAGFNFGECQDGTQVDSVILPDWAKGDPRLFVLKHRQVSVRNLHYTVIALCAV